MNDFSSIINKLLLKKIIDELEKLIYSLSLIMPLMNFITFIKYFFYFKKAIIFLIFKKNN